VFDVGRGIEGERPVVVDAAAFALAVATTVAAGAAFGFVVGDGAAGDDESGARADKDTATFASLPLPPAPPSPPSASFWVMVLPVRLTEALSAMPKVEKPPTASPPAQALPPLAPAPPAPPRA
jgi:hypothetical protein